METLFLQPNQYLRSVDQAGALSLRGPKKIYTASAKREFDGMDGWDGMGWDGMGYQKCPSIFFILCMYIDQVYIYLYT